MPQRKRNKATKEFLHIHIAGDFYQFRIYKVTDAAHQVYYIGSPVSHGGTKLADTLEELYNQLDAEAPILNSWLDKVK